ncbi:MAG TPA: ATP-binding cassette domain-containing protein [Stellaceae bacterium]|nr:ATP-binding cassette domain-containing protein [Stellaceae bacterium]
MTPVLETRALRKSFGAVVAARAVSVRVARGERLGLIGSNGAGKTTFVNMVTGYLRPDEGAVLLEGRDITGFPPRLLRRQGMSRSFQIPQLFASLTPEENLLLALGLQRREGVSAWRPARSGALVEELEALLKRFRLLPYRTQAIGALPGGVRKLVDIAMAVARGPKLLLLDEPTSGVAAEEKFPLMDVVMEALEEESVTILFIEHDMEIIARFARRVMAFHEGGIIADDRPEIVLSDEGVQRYVTGRGA